VKRFDDFDGFGNATGFQLPHPTSDSADLIAHATAALHGIYRPGPHYAKCGVMLTDLCPAAAAQPDLFDTRNAARSHQLMTALDSINRRMGRDTVFYAGSGVHRDWKAHANMKTQQFTTDWRQVLTVRS
jgi:DNA polymerase V